MADAELGQQAHAVQIGHVNVRDDQIRGMAVDSIERGLAVAGSVHAVAFLRKNFPEQRDRFFVVIDNQYMSRLVH
jgi:hypothetical protein